MKIESYEIPNSWEFTTMGDISTVIGGGTPKTKEPDNYEDGNIPWLTPADLSGYTKKTVGHGKRFITEKGLLTSSARMMPAGTVLYTSRAPIGYVVIASNPICTNQGFKSFILNDGILPDYVYWYLKGSKDIAESFASGTTFLELSGASAKKLPIPIAPLGEQKRIVAEIEKQFSRLDEAVKNLKRVKANLKQYKASVLKAAVEGKLTEKWRKKHPDVEPADKLLERILSERRKKWEKAELAKMKAKGKEPKNDKWKKEYKIPALPDRLEFPLIPNAWVWATPELLATDVDNAICAGPFGTIFKAKDFRSQGIPIIFLRHVAPGEYLTQKPGFMDTAKWNELFQTYSVDGGELLITKLGDPPGVCAIYPKNIGPAMVTPDVIKMSVNEDFMAPSYLMNYFNSQISRNFVTGFAFGTTRLRLTLPIFRNFPVPLPSVKEQHQIIAEIDTRISIVKRLDEIIQKSLIRAERLSQSVLKSAFTGKLVKQDPLDEPARNLLKRIKAERERQEDELRKKRKKRKKTMTTKEKPKKKKDILAVLKGSEAPMRPEDLFRIAGYEPVEVEDFYADLKIADQQKTISQIKKKNGEVLLRAV